MRTLSIHALLSLLLTAATFFSAVRCDAPIDLGLAAPYAILAGSTVTSTGTVGTIVNGDIGISPGTAIVGFPPAVLNGHFDSANGASGGAQGALTAAYNVAAAKPLTATKTGTDLGGLTLLPGVYKFDGTAAMNGMLTLDANGDSSAIWTFQIGSSLLIAGGSSVVFKDSIGNPDYVYWQVGTTATLATGVSMVGNILALTSVVVNDGATIRGRCLARNAEVTLDRSVVTKPPAFGAPTSQPSASPTMPTSQPSSQPSKRPNAHPSAQPSRQPSGQPSAHPTLHKPPTRKPSVSPTRQFNSQSIDLGLAEPYAILAGSTVTSTGTVGTVVTGNVGIFPGTAMTGFPPAVLNGAFDSANGASGSAQKDLTTAYNVAAARQFTTTLTNSDLGGMTLLPGVYKYDGTAVLNGILTLDADGDSSAVWTFQVGSSLLFAGSSSVIFKDSIGNPDFVYWQVGTTATLAKDVSIIGNILAFASIVVNDGATIQGRCLALNAAVTLDRSVITKPAKISFSATQTVSGISLDQYNADPVLNSATLKESIAQTMTGVQSTDIQNLEVTAGSTSAAKSLRVLTTSSIVLNYVVTVASTLTAEELQAQLTAAVEDGTFTVIMQNTGEANGATDLQAATSDTIDTETITEDSADSSSDKETLSTGAIIGIVIGGFFGLVLIAMLIYYCAGMGGSVGAGAHKHAEVSMNVV